jgi:hypothetical protein
VSPLRDLNGHHEPRWRLRVFYMWCILFTLATSFALYKVQDYANTNRSLIGQVRQNQRDIVHTGDLATYKLCVSVRKGKLDRIDEYQFTLQRTIQLFHKNPLLPRDQLKITKDFYHALIRRTRKSIVPCPPVKESR